MKAAGTVPAAGVPVRAAEFRKKKTLTYLAARRLSRSAGPAGQGRGDDVGILAFLCQAPDGKDCVRRPRFQGCLHRWRRYCQIVEASATFRRP